MVFLCHVNICDSSNHFHSARTDWRKWLAHNLISLYLFMFAVSSQRAFEDSYLRVTGAGTVCQPEQRKSHPALKTGRPEYADIKRVSVLTSFYINVNIFLACLYQVRWGTLIDRDNGAGSVCIGVRLSFLLVFVSQILIHVLKVKLFLLSSVIVYFSIAHGLKVRLFFSSCIMAIKHGSPTMSNRMLVFVFLYISHISSRLYFHLKAYRWKVELWYRF